MFWGFLWICLVLNYLLSRRQSIYRGKITLVYCCLGRRYFKKQNKTNQHLPAFYLVVPIVLIHSVAGLNGG